MILLVAVLFYTLAAITGANGVTSTPMERWMALKSGAKHKDEGYNKRVFMYTMYITLFLTVFSAGPVLYYHFATQSLPTSVFISVIALTSWRIYGIIDLVSDMHSTTEEVLDKYLSRAFKFDTIKGYEYYYYTEAVVVFLVRLYIIFNLVLIII